MGVAGMFRSTDWPKLSSVCRESSGVYLVVGASSSSSPKTSSRAASSATIFIAANDLEGDPDVDRICATSQISRLILLLGVTEASAASAGLALLSQVRKPSLRALLGYLLISVTLFIPDVSFKIAEHSRAKLS